MQNWIQKLLFLDKPVSPPADKPKTATQKGQPTRTSVAGSGPRCFLPLIDNSGSMQGTDFPPSRIAAACGAVVDLAQFLLNKSPSSYLGIGTFATDFHLCTAPAEVKSRCSEIVASLADLGEVGSTEMRKGLLGIHGMMRSCPKGMQVVVIMLTDGHNTGRNPVRVAQEIRETGADIWAIGIGARPQYVDEPLLSRIVSRPENYFFVGNFQGPQAIVQAFEYVAGLYFLDAEEEE